MRTKRILAIIMILIMSATAATTVFAHGFGRGRTPDGHGHRQWSDTLQCCFDNAENIWLNCISWDADGNIVFAEGCRRVDADGNLIPWETLREGRGQGRGIGLCRRLQE